MCHTAMAALILNIISFILEGSFFPFLLTKHLLITQTAGAVVDHIKAAASVVSFVTMVRLVGPSLPNSQLLPSETRS